MLLHVVPALAPALVSRNLCALFSSVCKTGAVGLASLTLKRMKPARVAQSCAREPWQGVKRGEHSPGLQPFRFYLSVLPETPWVNHVASACISSLLVTSQCLTGAGMADMVMIVRCSNTKVMGAS